MEEGDVEGLYDDLEDTDLGEKIHKLEKINEELKSHIHNLESDITKLMNEVVELKKTQETLTKNISELFNTAQAELQRKDLLIADLRSQLDDVILRRVGRKRAPLNNDHKQDNNRKRMRLDETKNDDRNKNDDRSKNLDTKNDKRFDERRNLDKTGKNIGENHDKYNKGSLRVENVGRINDSSDRHHKLNSKDENHRRNREKEDNLRRNVERSRDRNSRSNSNDFLQRKPEIRDKLSRSNSRDNRQEKWNKSRDIVNKGSTNLYKDRRQDVRQDSSHKSRNYDDSRCHNRVSRLGEEPRAQYNKRRDKSLQNKAGRDLEKNIQSEIKEKLRKKNPQDMEEGEISIIESSGDEIILCDNLTKDTCDETIHPENAVCNVNSPKTGESTKQKSQNLEILRNGTEPNKQRTKPEVLQKDPNVTDAIKLGTNNSSVDKLVLIKNDQITYEKTINNVDIPSNELPKLSSKSEIPQVVINELNKHINKSQTLQEVVPKQDQTCSDHTLQSVVDDQQIAICLEYQSLNGANALSKLAENVSLSSSNNTTVESVTNSSLLMNSNVGLNTPGSVNVRRKRRRCVVQLNDG